MADLQPLDDNGALDDLDTEQISNDVGDVFTQAQAAVAAGHPPAGPETDITQQGAGTAPDLAHAQDQAGSTPAPATANPSNVSGNSPGVIPPPPPPPQLTGDPQRDVQANIAHQRALADYHDLLTTKHAEVTARAAVVTDERAKREAETARQEATQRVAEQKAYAEQRQARQTTIDNAVKEKIAAAGDVEGANWMQRNAGAAIFAAIAGAVAQGMNNRAAALLGHAPSAENEGLKTIDRLMSREYEQRKDRYARANESLLQARYGFKDAADNHRAAMNDLDADVAAKYRLIAKETEAQLRQNGAHDAAVQNSLLRTEALQKAAQLEGQIHSREEGHEVARENAKANQRLAGAHLALQREQIDATKAAAGEKADDKADHETVRDENGNKIGRVPTGRGGAQAFATRDADYTRALTQLEALKADIKDNGGRVLLPEAVKRRQTLKENADIAVATVSPLGKTDEAMKKEAASIGQSGAYTLTGANPEAVARKIEELKDQRERYRKATLIPLKPAIEKPKAKLPAPERPKTLTLGGVVYSLKPDGSYE